MVSEVDRMRGFYSANLVPGEIAVELSEKQFGGAFFVVADAVDDPLRHDDAKFRECLFDVWPVYVYDLHRQTVHVAVHEHLQSSAVDNKP